MVIAGTAIFASFSSTIFLQMFTHPYVVSMREVSEGCEGDRAFSAVRLNLLGNETTSSFRLSEARRVSAAAHPFASFSAGKRFYYVFGADLRDAGLRSTLAH